MQLNYTSNEIDSKVFFILIYLLEFEIQQSNHTKHFIKHFGRV